MLPAPLKLADIYGPLVFIPDLDGETAPDNYLISLHRRPFAGAAQIFCSRQLAGQLPLPVIRVFWKIDLKFNNVIFILRNRRCFKLKKVIILILSAVLCLSLLYNTAYAIQYRAIYQSKYYSLIRPDHGVCLYGTIPTDYYVSNLMAELSQIPGWTAASTYSDRYAMEKYINSNRNNFADLTEFFIWAGHGLGISSQLGQGAFHFFNLNSSTVWHPIDNHFLDECNATWDEIRWGRKLRWASAYTCNFLKTGGSSANLEKIHKMFQGLHIITGFASTMYIRPDEGTTYGKLLRQGYVFKDAWVNAARKHQPKLSDVGFQINAAWAYHKAYEGDTIYASTAPAPSYSSSTKTDFGRKYYTVNY